MSDDSQPAVTALPATKKRMNLRTPEVMKLVQEQVAPGHELAVRHSYPVARRHVPEQVGVGLDRYLAGSADARQEISLRLAYLMARVFLLALAVILVRKSDGKDAALTTLGVVVFAFTVALAISFLNRPRTVK